MKVYVASGFGNWRAVRDLYEVLEDHGHDITYDWTLVAKNVEYGYIGGRSIGGGE